MQFTALLICVLLSFSEVSSIQTQKVDIVQTAIDNGNFKTLVKALQAASLVTTLKSNRPFTVFAPTDAAFSKLGARTIEDLLRPENKGKLTQILKYHVVNGRRLTSTQINALALPAKVHMLGGGAITVRKNGSNLKVNNATVVIPDVITTNGIIHAIDAVLIPPGMNFATSFSLNQ